MRSDIVPGAIFPDYELSDHTAKRRKLSELQGQHPMVLVLSRGGFCPKDRRQAELLVQLHRELDVAYCRLVTISTDNISETNEYRTGVGAHWPFLSDAGRIVQKDLDIAEYTDPAHNPMIPHVIVLEPGLVIYKMYNGYWSSAGPLWKISARTCVPLPRNADETGTSRRPNSERRGSKAARNSSIRTAKRMSKLSVNRTNTGKACSCLTGAQRKVALWRGIRTGPLTSCRKPVPTRWPSEVL
jgi:peroxiredoxin